MRPRDYDGPDDPAVARRFLEALARWEQDQRDLIARQDVARAVLQAAEDRRTMLQGWVNRLRDLVAATGDAVTEVFARDTDLARIGAELDDVEAELEEHAQARETATARLLGGPATSEPLLLAPLRLETSWENATLHVRIYPDELGVASHDPTLTADESTWGDHYWSVRSGTTAADEQQTWLQLVRRFGPQRAAWVVRATRPGQPRPDPRGSPWPSPPQARLLPDRFAVMAFADGEPVDVGPATEPRSPRFVTWGAPVTEPLACGPLADGDAAAWMTDLGAARDAGMAVSIPVPPGAPPIDLLAVVGIRTGPGDLAGLLDAHAFTGGVELMADGTPTNNSGTLRSARRPRRDDEVARGLLDDPVSADLADGTAGAQLAGVLGLPRARLALFAGAADERAAPAAAMRLLVGLATGGALHGTLEQHDAAAVWPLVLPGGPSPVVRVGDQPYGVLPATAPGRWQPRDGEAGQGLTAVLHRWAAATGPVVATDPAAPPEPVGGGTARQVTRDDDSALPELLLESASAVRWEGDGTAFEGLAGIVGAAEGEQSPAAYLALLAATAPGDLDGLPAGGLPPTLLARVALAAKRRADPAQVGAVNAALATLGRRSGEELARLLGELLDTISHRLDPWLTALVTERLAALRDAQAGTTAVGAFGWLTDVAPRGDARSHGHVHAPSLGHAATAAVLRSAFLGQRRHGWAAEVAAARDRLAEAEANLADVQADRGNLEPHQFAALLRSASQLVDGAQARLEAAEQGLRTLGPLDPQAEARLALAVDVSSRRVRGARWVLDAVRSGQPLGAVLGYQFERDLVDAGLPQFLAAFRKLTRFRTGSALEQLEEKRDQARAALAEARRQLAVLQGQAADLRQPVVDASGQVGAAAAQVERADAAAAPYLQMQQELRVLDETTIPQARARLAEVDGRRPPGATHRRTIQVPVPP